MVEAELRVLVVGEAGPVMERCRRHLHAAPGVALLGQTTDLTQAVELASAQGPDVVVACHGSGEVVVAFVRRLMRAAPAPIIVGTQELDSRVVALAVGEGAVEPFYFSLSLGREQEERTSLVSMLRVMSQVKVVRRWSRNAPTRSGSGLSSIEQGGRLAARRFATVRALLIGASTGGPELVYWLLTQVGHFRVPVVLAQHMTPGFESSFREWLATSGHEVVLIGATTSLRAGVVYVAPADGDAVFFAPDLVGRTARSLPWVAPCIDALFLSAVQSGGLGLGALLLTGMGSDGAKGLLALRNAGAVTVSQDEASSAIFGMPQEAQRLGAAEFVLSRQALPLVLTEARLAEPRSATK